MNNTFFYSDPHFGHSKILELASRPFADTQVMDRELVERYRETVGKDDIVYWLGDCAFSAAGRAAVGGLPGRRILIRGNHDMKLSMRKINEMGFELVTDSARMSILGVTVRLCHYPYADQARAGQETMYLYPPRIKGEFLIHGHTHSPKKYQNRAIHVGVDAWDFLPVPIEEIAAIIRQKEQVKNEK